MVRPNTDPNVVTQSVTVSFADLDLSKDAGAHALLVRINAAAKQVCEPQDRDFKLIASRRSCIETAVDRAVAEVNNPKVTSLRQGD